MGIFTHMVYMVNQGRFETHTDTVRVLDTSLPQSWKIQCISQVGEIKV